MPDLERRHVVYLYGYLFLVYHGCMLKRTVLLLVLLISISGSLIAGDFVVKHFVDDFGDPTDEPYITTTYRKNGTFSNSATTNSPLTWNILITDSSVSFMLYEYKDRQVTGSTISPDEYMIKVKDSGGKVHTLYGENWSDRIVLDRGSDFRKILEKEGIVKIVIADISGYSYSEYNLGSLNADGYRYLYAKTFGIPVHVEVSSNVWVHGAKMLGEHPEIIKDSVRVELTIRDKYGNLVFDETEQEGKYLTADFVAEMTQRYTVEVRYFVGETETGLHSETLVPSINKDVYSYKITIDDLYDNAFSVAEEAYKKADAERIAKEEAEKQQQLEAEQRRAAEAERQHLAKEAEKQKPESEAAKGNVDRENTPAPYQEYRNTVPSMREDKKKMDFSIGLNIGYYGSLFNCSFFRTGVDLTITWPVDMFILGLRLDGSVYTHGAGMSYPGYDISASFVLGTDISDFGSGKVFLETAYGLGYLHSIDGLSGELFGTVIFRVLAGIGVRFGGFELNADLLLDTGIYSTYDSYFGYNTTGLELALVPMISIGYAF